MQVHLWGNCGVPLSALSFCNPEIRGLSCDIAKRQSRKLLHLCLSLLLIDFLFV